MFGVQVGIESRTAGPKVVRQGRVLCLCHDMRATQNELAQVRVSSQLDSTAQSTRRIHRIGVLIVDGVYVQQVQVAVCIRRVSTAVGMLTSTYDAKENPFKMIFFLSIVTLVEGSRRRAQENQRVDLGTTPARLRRNEDCLNRENDKRKINNLF